MTGGPAVDLQFIVPDHLLHLEVPEGGVGELAVTLQYYFNKPCCPCYSPQNRQLIDGKHLYLNPTIEIEANNSGPSISKAVIDDEILLENGKFLLVSPEGTSPWRGSWTWRGAPGRPAGRSSARRSCGWGGTSAHS